MRHFLLKCLFTFQSIKEVQVKTGISSRKLIPGGTILPFKIMINKFKSSFSCKLSFSMIVNIIPCWVLLIFLRICLNIFDQSDQFIAVYLENIFEKLTFLNINSWHQQLCNSENSTAHVSSTCRTGLHRRPWHTAAEIHDLSGLKKSSQFSLWIRIIYHS